MYLIYKHTSPSGKSYIGQTNDYDRRCRDHQQPSSRCVKFRAAINKYGWDNFTHEILEESLTLLLANEQEEYWINFYDCVNSGYNLLNGGLNRTHAEETKVKFRLRRHSELTIEKIKNKSPRSKPIIIYDIQYQSINEAAKTLGMQSSVIWRGLKSGRKGFSYVK